MNIPRWEKFAAGADNHGIEQDNEAVAAFLRFVKDFKPKRRIQSAMRDGATFAPAALLGYGHGERSGGRSA